MSPHPNLRRKSSIIRRTALVLLGLTAFAGTVRALLIERPGSAVFAAPARQSVPPASPELMFYLQSVQPIFQANCYRCHAGFNHRGGFRMDSQAGMLRGGHDGAVVVPGHPEQSLLVKLIRHEGPANNSMPMPPKSKLSDADIATITRWIQAGALMPPASPD